jgi:putative addiction module killer protein
MELRDYLDTEGRDLFAEWLAALDPQARAKVVVHLTRLKNGNFSNVKGVNQGVFEKKVDWGPGYRIYFGKDGEDLIILLGGGSKARQDDDIKDAHARWRDYKQRSKKR